MANQTMSNLRTYKAICDTNIKPCPPPKTLSQDHESKLIFAKRRYCLIMLDILVILYWMFLSLYKCQNTLPSPTFILFPSHFTDSFGKDAQARHLSNSTKVTKVSRVSNTTGSPLDSIYFHRFEAWSHRPRVPSTRPWLLPCQCYCLPS